MNATVTVSGPLFQRPDLTAALSAGMDEALALIAHRLQANLSGGVTRSGPGRYGHLASMIRTQSVVTTDNVQGRVFPDRRAAFKLRFLELGTAAHAITPRRARGRQRSALAIPVGGGLIFRRRAAHPGTPPHAVLERTLQQAWPAAQEKLQQPVIEAVGGQ